MEKDLPVVEEKKEELPKEDQEVEAFKVIEFEGKQYLCH
jgi:hypothetical protein